MPMTGVERRRGCYTDGGGCDAIGRRQDVEFDCGRHVCVGRVPIGKSARRRRATSAESVQAVLENTEDFKKDPNAGYMAKVEQLTYPIDIEHRRHRATYPPSIGSKTPVTFFAPSEQR
jgi:hypothetical protein